VDYRWIGRGVFGEPTHAKIEDKYIWLRIKTTKCAVLIVHWFVYYNTIFTF